MANPLSGVTQVFHIGRPDLEEPQRSMERCEKFHARNPEAKLVVFLWDQKDVDEFTPKKHSNCEVVFWDDDTKLMSWLLDRLASIVGTRIVWPQWFVCPDKHITAFDYEKPVEKCETCSSGVALVHPHEAKLKEFVSLFEKVISLTNFDTRSGEYLYAAVNPTANVLKNMPAALGCAHERPLDVKGCGKGKPALLCAAGPSLDLAIPYLRRLQRECVVLCVGRVFKKLRAAGIQPDFALSVEMFDWDSAIFDGLTPEEASHTILAFASVCAPETVRKWPGRKVCMWDIESAKLLGRTDWIFGGNSVAHHQLNFAAQILDCEPLILIGNDLAYTVPKSHADGSAPDGWPEEVKEQDASFHREEVWVPCTGKGQDFHPDCHRTPVAIGGGGALPSRQIEVRSSRPYANFATLFSILIAKHGRKVLNACSNGQKIPGTEYLDLATYDPSGEPNSESVPMVTRAEQAHP